MKEESIRNYLKRDGREFEVRSISEKNGVLNISTTYMNFFLYNNEFYSSRSPDFKILNMDLIEYLIDRMDSYIDKCESNLSKDKYFLSEIKNKISDDEGRVYFKFDLVNTGVFFLSVSKNRYDFNTDLKNRKITNPPTWLEIYRVLSNVGIVPWYDNSQHGLVPLHASLQKKDILDMNESDLIDVISKEGWIPIKST